MKTIFRWIGVALSACWTIQYGYWAVCMLAWRAGYHEWPLVSGDWQFLACCCGFWLGADTIIKRAAPERPNE
jgi:hypothetical protein